MGIQSRMYFLANIQISEPYTLIKKGFVKVSAVTHIVGSTSHTCHFRIAYEALGGSANLLVGFKNREDVSFH